MPIGSHHDETGWLNIHSHELVLRRDAGGTWQLDVPGKARAWVGKRVTVTGKRIDFEVLAVLSIEPLEP